MKYAIGLRYLRAGVLHQRLQIAYLKTWDATRVAASNRESPFGFDGPMSSGSYLQSMVSL